MNKKELFQIPEEELDKMSEEALRAVLQNIYQCLDEDVLAKASQGARENIVKEVLIYTHEMGQTWGAEQLNAKTKDELFSMLKDARAFHSMKKLNKEFEQLKSKEALLSRVSFGLKWYAEKQKTQEFHQEQNTLRQELLSMLFKPTNNREKELYSMLKTVIKELGWQLEFRNKGADKTEENNTEIENEILSHALCFSDKPVDLNLFSGEWNVERLYKSLLEIITDTDGYGPIIIKAPIDDVSFRVKAQRVAAVFSAFGKEVKMKILGKFISYEIYNIVNDVCSEDKVKEMCNIIGYKYVKSEEEYLESFKYKVPADYVKYHMETLGHLRKSRESLFHSLLQYRLKCRGVINHWQGCIEGILCVMLVRISKNIISTNFEKDVKQLDRLLILMMGDGYDKSFSERELITNFNYPAITDSELLELEECL